MKKGEMSITGSSSLDLSMSSLQMEVKYAPGQMTLSTDFSELREAFWIRFEICSKYDFSEMEWFFFETDFVHHIFGHLSETDSW